MSALAKPMTLYDRIMQIDHIQARRFSKLTGETAEIATEGIIRHLRACARMDVNPGYFRRPRNHRRRDQRQKSFCGNFQRSTRRIIRFILFAVILYF